MKSKRRFLRCCKQAEELSKNAGEAASEAETLRGREALALSAAADSRAEVAALRSTLSEMDERESAIAAEQESGEAQLSETRKSAAENRRALESAQEEADAIRNIIAGHTMKMQGRIEREKETGEQHVSLTMEMNNLDSRIRLLGEMEKEYEGFNKAVRTVMQASERKALRGVRGPVANLMKVGKKYAVAIEIALGAGLQNIVVEREEDAKSAIQLLKQRDGGRATFLPLSSIRGEALRDARVQNEYGYVGLASELVEYDREYDGIFKNLLGRTVVVEDLDCGITISRRFSNAFRIVTLDGQVLNRGGSMTGGSISRSAGILSRAGELRELTARRGSLAEKLDLAAKAAEDAKRELAKARYELEVAQGQQRAAEDAVLKLQGDKNHYDLLLSSLRERLESIGYRARDHRAPPRRSEARGGGKGSARAFAGEGSGRAARAGGKEPFRPERAAAFDLAPRRRDRREKERTRRLCRRARDDGKVARELGGPACSDAGRRAEQTRAHRAVQGRERAVAARDRHT